MTNHAAFERLVATGLDFSLDSHDADGRRGASRDLPVLPCDRRAVPG